MAGHPRRRHHQLVAALVVGEHRELQLPDADRGVGQGLAPIGRHGAPERCLGHRFADQDGARQNDGESGQEGSRTGKVDHDLVPRLEVGVNAEFAPMIRIAGEKPNCRPRIRICSGQEAARHGE